MNQPLIILGMHRSGTSMLTRILRQQGVFLGHKIQSDDEAMFFLELNRWVLRVAGTDWDHPTPALEMLKDEGTVTRIANHLATRLSGTRTYPYLGTHILKAGMRIGTHLPFLWGFKDPRTCITLPAWLKLFPEARLLRIQRHGVDVAASLETRQTGAVKEQLGQYSRRVRMGLADPARTHIVGSVRCNTLGGGVELWSEYERALDDYLADIPQQQQMHLRYEDYLTDFAGLHPKVASFVGIDSSVPLPPGIRPDPSRAFAYRSEARCVEAAEQFAPLLAQHGY
ncbi:MAG: sulfotransferase [Erythrobacter sp.]